MMIFLKRFKICSYSAILAVGLGGILVILTIYGGYHIFFKGHSGERHSLTLSEVTAHTAEALNGNGNSARCLFKYYMTNEAMDLSKAKKWHDVGLKLGGQTWATKNTSDYLAELIFKEEKE